MIFEDRPIDGREYDVCIVGAGPVGITLALELGALGRNVLLLESGGDALDPAQSELSAAEIVGEQNHDDMRIAVRRQIGGTSNLWGGRCVPYDAIDFSRRSWVAPEVLWPLALAEVEPFFEKAAAYANCGPAQFRLQEPLVPEDQDIDIAALERWSRIPSFRKAHRSRLAASLNVHVHTGSTVVGLDHAGKRVRALLVHRRAGHCEQARARTIVLAMGGIETTRLLLSDQRLRPSCYGGKDGPLGRYYMGHLIGEVADIRFASEQAEERFDFLRLGGTFARRRFALTAAAQARHALPNAVFWPVVPPIANPAHRSGLLSAVSLVLSSKLGPHLMQEAIRRRHLPEAGLNRREHLRNVLLDLPGTLRGSARLLWERYGARSRHPGLFVRNRARLYGLSYHAEHLPNPESRVTLSDEVDTSGLARARIELRFSDQDIAGVVRSHEVLKKWVEHEGIGTIEFRQPENLNASAVRQQAKHGTHQIGLARMSELVGEGVVDSQLRCHGVDNLFVCGTAVLPTSSQANPTFMAIALALRLASHLSRQIDV